MNTISTTQKWVIVVAYMGIVMGAIAGVVLAVDFLVGESCKKNIEINVS